MQQITRGDYLKDLITIYVDNNLQTSLTDLYSQFVFQCGDIQKFLTPAQVIKISFSEQESQLLNNYNTCYLAGITTDGHKETFNGSLTFNTRGEVVFYEPPVSTVTPAATETTCDCQGLRGFFSNCTQPAIKAYFSLNYVPTKLSELQNDTDFVDSFDLTRAVSEHNTSTEAHQYIQDLVATEASLRASQTNALGIRIGTEESVRASQTEALHQSILAEVTAREQAVSLAISTTESYADTQISNHNSSEQAHPYIQSALVSATEAINVTIGDLDNLNTANKSSVVNAINSEVTARENADNNLQTQIDGLAAASDVTDIVGTYQELQNYDTQHLNNNDIIKVLSDETHDDEPSYYRFNKTAGTFSYIGSESASYTKAQSDSIFVTQTTEINGHALSSDINLTASDVGALSDTTTINDLTNTAQQNALNSGVTSSVVSQVSTNTSAIATNTSAIASNTSVIAQHTTAIASNTSDISTINGKIPTDASTSNKLVSASTLAASIADFANQDLSNLTENGEGRLHALKSYADKGELLTDPDGLAFVEKYAHSTFDRSKFTVVGSPNITDDGIASKGSLSNNVMIDFDLKQLKDKSWTIRYPFNFNGVNAGMLWAIVLSDTHWDWKNTYSHTIVENTHIYQTIQAGIGDSKDTGFNQFYIDSNWYGSHLNEVLTYELSFDLTTGVYTGKLFDSNGNILGTERTYTPDCDNKQLTAILDTDNIWTLRVVSGSSQTCDLKQFSIKVDGIEVFNGNKTGIDTIKPDDYTVVGTPTISADGVASGFSGSNYFNSVYTLDLSKPFQIYSTFIVGNDITTDQCVYGWDSYLQFGVRSGALEGSYNLIAKSVNIQPNTKYETINYFTGTESYFKIRPFGTAEWAESEHITSVASSGVTTSIRIGGIWNNSQYFLGSIDLNAFKIYVDGNLVYQPCLKIPYTESKTGSKVVNAIYRDRVNDMAEQFGYANYYTLSDTDFTLPQVELYGLIGQRTLRDSYRNGINYWELYSNRDLEQGGSCTSGVEVTFARPFVDTNYVLSVPYSAKSSTAFTPTQTGDWIAKGKGLL